jgi:hypothetical protein
MTGFTAVNLKQFPVVIDFHFYDKRRDSSAGKVTGYGLKDRSSIPGRDRDIYIFATTTKPTLSRTEPPTSGYRGSLPCG